MDKAFSLEQVTDNQYILIEDEEELTKAKKSFKRAVARSWLKHQQERKQRVATAHSLEFTNIQRHFM